LAKIKWGARREVERRDRHVLAGAPDRMPAAVADSIFFGKVRQSSSSRPATAVIPSSTSCSQTMNHDIPAKLQVRKVSPSPIEKPL
jgi:hypothetical protein